MITLFNSFDRFKVNCNCKSPLSCQTNCVAGYFEYAQIFHSFPMLKLNFFSCEYSEWIGKYYLMCFINFGCLAIIDSGFYWWAVLNILKRLVNFQFVSQCIQCCKELGYQYCILFYKPLFLHMIIMLHWVTDRSGFYWFGIQECSLIKKNMLPILSYVLSTWWRGMKVYLLALIFLLVMFLFFIYCLRESISLVL